MFIRSYSLVVSIFVQACSTLYIYSGSLKKCYLHARGEGRNMLKHSKLSNFYAFWAFQFLMTIPKKNSATSTIIGQPKVSTYLRRLKIQVHNGIYIYIHVHIHIHVLSLVIPIPRIRSPGEDLPSRAVSGWWGRCWSGAGNGPLQRCQGLISGFPVESCESWAGFWGVKGGCYEREPNNKCKWRLVWQDWGYNCDYFK